MFLFVFFFFFQAEDGIRDYKVTGVQTCALPICGRNAARARCRLRPTEHQGHGPGRVSHVRRGGEVGVRRRRRTPVDRLRADTDLPRRGRDVRLWAVTPPRPGLRLLPLETPPTARTFAPGAPS